MSQFFSGYLTAVFTFVLLCTASRLVGYVIKKSDSEERRKEKDNRMTVFIKNQELIISMLNKSRFDSDSFDSLENKFRRRSRSNSVPESSCTGTGTNPQSESSSSATGTNSHSESSSNTAENNSLCESSSNTTENNFLIGMTVGEAIKVVKEKGLKLNIICVTVGNMTATYDKVEGAVSISVHATSFDDVESGLIVGCK